ncbi:MAG TPA: Asp-tRNA(Asn)/Glu-tRNA(Gln) amidotransferase subunit GatA [Candidatus Wallbacteria bacterium]|nr:Asp-tRNA(Asn)/Glu-tRNA(Gln) amidotransferase subunit GatA [Candidatus Wallbacteria bacterium]
MPAHFKPAHEIRKMIDAKEISEAELMESAVRRSKETNGLLNAFLSINGGAEGFSGVKNSFWAGIPVALKDNIVTKGIKTTAGSKILENYTPIYDATVVQKLKNAGAPIVGKTNMDEFAMGSSTENSAFGVTKNPWDITRVPGGSSGGSAVAVASGLAYMALGSDTGGSIRQPAALCGVCGMKPTYGRVSRYGLIAFASSLDQIGPFTRDALDMAYALDVICGHDPKDSTSSAAPAESFSDFVKKGMDMNGVKIGIPDEYFGDGIEQGVAERVKEAINQFEKMGAKIVSVKLPHTKYAIPVYYLIATAEASSNLSRFDGVKYGFRAAEFKNLKDMYMKTRDEGFGAEVKRRIILGTYALSSGYYDAYYKTAQKARTKIKEDFQAAFSRADLILSPVTPATAFKIGEKTADPLTMYMSDIFTISANLASIPALSIPCGLSGGMPVGLQLSGNYFQEGKMLAAAYEFQKRTDHHLCVAAV